MGSSRLYRELYGDATRPEGPRPLVVAHVVNDDGRWGAGFTGALSRRWPHVEDSYRRWVSGFPAARPRLMLGDVQVAEAEAGVWVANMVAQHGNGYSINGVPPIRYAALRRCLALVAEAASTNGLSVHLPRIGYGLAGGRWEWAETIIRDTLLEAGVPTTIYYRES
jgi:O-acetyl-ADP-ribose deacetylase (regulator of RNase III)